MTTIENKLVFIVEDNEMYSTMLDYTLSNDSIVKFICFKTGEECLENLKLNPMMIILDYWLPGINGLETFKKIRKNNSTVPVVVLTQDHDLDIATALLNNGVNDYFNKGGSAIEEIKEIINHQLGIIIEKEEAKTRRMRTLFFIFWLIAITIVIIYAKRF